MDIAERRSTESLAAREASRRIKDLLQLWADSKGDEAPAADIARLSAEIERLAPSFKTLIALEYADGRPQKTKAAQLGIPRERFSRGLQFVHEQLIYVMFSV